MPDLTLPYFLQRAENEFPELGIHYIHDDGATHFQSYPELLQEAKSIGCGLQSFGRNPEIKQF
jgi:hypothetical protein